jgi:hypothetical protein
VSSLGHDWTDEAPSQSRFSAKTIFVGTGADIADITTQSNIPAVLCVEDGSGFLANNFYVRHWDITTSQWTGWDNVKWKHTHKDNIDADGGGYYEMDAAVADSYIGINEPYCITLQFFGGASASGGAAVQDAEANNSCFLRLRTGTTSNNYAYVQKGGTRLSFAAKIEWHIKMEVDGGNSQILWRCGPGMEKPQDNSEAVEKKIGLEGCTGDGINIQITNCDGATRLKTPTTVNMDLGQARGFKLAYTPSTNMIYNDSLSNTITVTSNIPSSGYILDDRLVRYGIKTTNATEKLLYIWSHALLGKRNDVNWI